MRSDYGLAYFCSFFLFWKEVTGNGYKNCSGIPAHLVRNILIFGSFSFSFHYIYSVFPFGSYLLLWVRLITCNCFSVCYSLHQCHGALSWHWPYINYCSVSPYLYLFWTIPFIWRTSLSFSLKTLYKISVLVVYFQFTPVIQFVLKSFLHCLTPHISAFQLLRLKSCHLPASLNPVHLSFCLYHGNIENDTLCTAHIDQQIRLLCAEGNWPRGHDQPKIGGDDYLGIYTVLKILA